MKKTTFLPIVNKPHPQKIVKVSVVIPTFNRKKELLTCLESLFKQSFKNFEVIVVDDGSVDGTKETLKKYGWLEKIQYLKNDQNKGVSVAKNKGIKNAIGKYLWFLDSDTKIISPNCLKILIRELDKLPKIGTIGCEIIERNKETLIREHTFFGNDKTYSNQEIIRKECDYNATCNCFTRKKLLLEIGGFNEYYYYGYEDAEFGKQIQKRGYLNILDSKVALLHLRSTWYRSANYRLFFKNRIRFTIWNFPLPEILKLPMSDVINFFDGINKAKNMPRTDIRGQAKSTANQKLGKIGLLTEYILGLISGYLWNILFLPQTLLRYNKRNFLRNE